MQATPSGVVAMCWVSATRDWVSCRGDSCISWRLPKSSVIECTEILCRIFKSFNIPGVQKFLDRINERVACRNGKAPEKVFWNGSVGKIAYFCKSKVKFQKISVKITFFCKIAEIFTCSAIKNYPIKIPEVKEVFKKERLRTFCIPGMFQNVFSELESFCILHNLIVITVILTIWKILEWVFRTM